MNLTDIMLFGEAINGDGGSKYEAEFPATGNQVLRVFSAPIQDGAGGSFEIEGVTMHKVWDDLPNVNGALTCTVVYVNDFAGNTASVTMSSANDTFFANDEANIAGGLDDSGFVFISVDVDAMGEEATALGITENGVYFREEIGVLGCAAMLFLCDV